MYIPKETLSLQAKKVLEQNVPLFTFYIATSKKLLQRQDGARQTIKTGLVLAVFQVHRQSTVPYMGIHWPDFYFLLGPLMGERLSNNNFHMLVFLTLSVHKK